MASDDTAIRTATDSAAHAAGGLAHEWIGAWNAHDVDRVMALYSPDAVHSSPLVARLGDGAEGRVRGASAVRAYFSDGLAATPGLRFELVEWFAGVDGVAVLYENQRGQRVVEAMVLREGLIVESRVYHASGPA